MAEGAVTWWEIDVPDVRRAQQFYGAVCPVWTFQPMEGFEGYVIVNVGGTGVGAHQASTDGGPSDRGTRLYVEVSNLENTLVRVRQGAGTVEQRGGRFPATSGSARPAIRSATGSAS
jgi:predicted enzyme related to lactoylglutathione lyase